jgi:hypothetical protein
MHLLAGYGINVRYNVICKKLEILIPGASGCPDNADNSALAQIISLATLNNIPIGQVTGYLEAIGDRKRLLSPWSTLNCLHRKNMNSTKEKGDVNTYQESRRDVDGWRRSDGDRTWC